MAYLPLEILSIDESLDRTTGERRMRASVREIEPRKLNINLSKADASMIKKFESLIGKRAMIPCREGMMNGQTFLSLLPDPIIEIPSIIEIKPSESTKTDDKSKLFSKT